jgi:hypothetical protein
MKLILAVLAFWLAPMTAIAQGSGADPLYQQIAANRGAYGRVIHLFGDSIARGYALGKFPDGADPLDPAHPLYDFRSIASTANLALTTNNRTERVAYGGNVSATLIASMVSRGTIRSGDVVVLEDAGDYAPGPNAYYSFWWSARQAAAINGVTVVMMSMFDYCHSGNLACNPAMQYDAAVGTQGTLNDATRRAAMVTTNATSASGSALAGVTRFADMNWIMDGWRSSALSVDGVDVMLPDGVHPNVWGQMRMVREILAVAGLRQYLTNVAPIQDLAAANYQSLSYGSATFTAARARAYVAANLGAN